MLCRRRRRKVCRLTGLTVERSVIDGGCVHHPDAETGALRWLWLRWYGVPAPLRWVLRGLIVLRVVRPLTGELAGCGCIAPLKDRWVRLCGRLRAVRARFRAVAAPAGKTTCRGEGCPQGRW